MAAFYAVGISSRKEERFLELYAQVLAKKQYPGVFGAFSSPKLKGFVIVEAKEPKYIIDSVRRMKFVLGVVRKEIQPHEIEKYFDEEEEEITKVAERDIVEITSDPFRGYKARVTRVSPVKNEIIVELLDIPNPIPVTLSVEDIKILHSENDN